jgi:hypothetical protein
MASRRIGMSNTWELGFMAMGESYYGNPRKHYEIHA